MKKPDTWKHEAWLRRILDADKFESIVYMEEAVLADSSTLMAKGYFLFLVTDVSFHFLQSGKDSSLSSSNSWLLTDFHSVLHLNDAAIFFGPGSGIAHHTRHIRVHISDQVASPTAVLDFYSFYEDSSLFHMLLQAWTHAHTRAALPVFYPLERNKLSKLSKLGVQALYNHLETQLLATNNNDNDEDAAIVAAAAAQAAQAQAAAASGSDENPTTPLKPKRAPNSDDPVEEERKSGAGDAASSSSSIDAAKVRAAALRLKRRRAAADEGYWDIRVRTRVLEEMTLASCAHRSFKAAVFDSPRLIPFLLGELRGLASLRKYMLGADPAAIWSLSSSGRSGGGGGGGASEALVEDEVLNMGYAIALWTFLSRTLAGSEALPSRTKLLAWTSTAREQELKQVMDDLFLLGGISLKGARNGAGAGANSGGGGMGMGMEPQTPANGVSGGGGGDLVTPTQFLEALDAHIEETSRYSNGKPNGGRFVDEEEKRYSQQHLYNMRSTRRWKEGVLSSHSEGLAKEASSASGSATRARMAAQISSLHLRDVARIVAAGREEAALLASRRGPSSVRGSSRRTPAREAAASIFDAPRTADEVGYEVVLVSNEAAERQGLAELVALVPELEVAYLELTFHFMQLLEFVLEAPRPLHGADAAGSGGGSTALATINLDCLFRHMLESTSQAEFKTMQLPVFARGLVYLCQKERRPAISYYCFVYSYVISKLMLRSAELQLILEEQHFLAQLTAPVSGASSSTPAHAASSARGQQLQPFQSQSSGPQLALLMDIKSTPHAAAASKGLYFYQRTKPLLQSMMELMVNK